MNFYFTLGTFTYLVSSSPTKVGKGNFRWDLQYFDLFT